MASHAANSIQNLQPLQEAAVPEISAAVANSSSSEASDTEEETESSIVHMARVLEELSVEDHAPKQQIYLGTFSRVLPEVRGEQNLCDVSTLTREELAVKVRDSWDHPAAVDGGGRPRQGVGGEQEHPTSVVAKMVVVREPHVSGDIHCHVGVKLVRSLRFRPAKLALRQRHRLESHWSCTHTKFYTVVRYMHIPSVTKPEVDPEPYSWSVGGGVLDLFAESQEPFLAGAWKRRREERDKKAVAGQKKHRSFTKIDLTAVILDQGLKTKAAVLAYTQDNGTAAMQSFVHQNKRKLKDYIEDAAEWSAAREAASLERESAWELLCRTADSDCPEGASCSYAACSNEIFQQNADVLCRTTLAFALRQSIIKGPSKTTRTPLIVGSTNTGKTTLVLPFDKLFGFKKVFHKPALGSKFALRNLMKDKIFLLWDDFRPVQYAQETVPTSTQLSLFTGLPLEIQVSQSFNDGNVDFEWRHGAVVTAKTPCRGVTEEDVRHLQSRFEVFRCAARVSSMRDVEGCPCHMSRWIRDGAAEQDSRAVLHPLLPTLPVAPAMAEAAELQDVAALVFETRMPHHAVSAMQQELLQLGAVSVRELLAAEWVTLQTWQLLKPLEQRRVLAWLR